MDINRKIPLRIENPFVNNKIYKGHPLFLNLSFAFQITPPPLSPSPLNCEHLRVLTFLYMYVCCVSYFRFN